MLKSNSLLWGALALLISCVTTPPSQDFKASTAFKYDMEIKVNGFKGVGVLVLPQAAQYEMEISSKSDIDLLTIRSCHRSHEYEKAWKDNGAFKGKDFAKVTLNLDNPIEKEYCVLDLGAWNKTGRHSFGFIDFYNPKLKLVAKSNCNGYTSNQTGVSICQAFIGTLQEISLPNKSVMRASTPDCEFALPDSKTFRYEIKKGVCVYLIKDLTTKEFHRLTTIGYDKIILKE
jgi:hypothetical protein